MYQALYRKWRPRTFDDVVGQEHITETLKNQVQTGHLSHAYLFVGTRGTGKTTCAKILAKTVNCLHPIDGDPCGECEICKGVDNGSIMDVVEIDAASNNGVENIRTLREEANFTPAAAKYRVYIIDEVHMLSVGAFNALLKTLEEPPEHVIFILATTEVHKLPATILSRCQRFDFNRIPPQEIADRLTYIAGEEHASLTPDAALLIARLSDGALRDALSLLDQCFSRSKNVTEPVVTEAAGLVGREHLFTLTDAVKSGNSAEALEIIDRLYRSSKDMARLCEEFSAHLRGMMLIKSMKNAKGILALPDSEYAELEKQALSTPFSTILHGMDLMQSSLEKMSRGGDRRTVFEMAVLRLCMPQLDSSPDALLRRVEALEQRALRGPSTLSPAIPVGESKEKPEKLEQKKPEPQVSSEEKHSPEVPENGEEQLQQLQSAAQKLAEWPEILQIVKSFSPSVSAAFNGSTAYVSGGYVLIDAPNQFAFQLLRKPEQRAHMRDAIRQITGKSYRLGPYRKPEPQKEGEDPLLRLAHDAEEEGIEVLRK